MNITNEQLQALIGYFHRPGDELVSAALRELLARREAERWIPVGEKLPASGTKVLVLQTGTIGTAIFIDTAWYDNSHWQNDNWHRDLDLNEVTHWRPLPAMPEGGGK